MSRLLPSLVICASLATGMTGSAEAGSQQGHAPKLPIEDVTSFADQVERNLAARGAHVAIVSRVGRDPASLPEGIAYTHVGIWVYSDITQHDGTQVRGYRVHNLYQRAEDLDVSDLVQDSPVDFFAGAQSLDAGIIVPDRRLQAKLVDVMTSPAYAGLHNAKYSAVANPDNNDYQNCTEHTLNLLMAALYNTHEMSRIKTNIRAHFDPQEINVGPLKRLFGPMVMDGVTMRDQGNAVRTTTFTTLAEFMKRFDLTESTHRQTRAGITPL